MTAAELARPLAEPGLYLAILLGWVGGRLLAWVSIRRRGLRVPRSQERALVLAVVSAVAVDRYVASLSPGGGLAALAVGWMQRDPGVWVPVGMNVLWILVAARILRVRLTPGADELYRPPPETGPRWLRIVALLSVVPMGAGAWFDASNPVLGGLGVLGAAAIPATIIAVTTTPAVLVTETGVQDDLRTIEWSLIRAWWIDATPRALALSIRFEQRPSLLGAFVPGFGRGSSGFTLGPDDEARVRAVFEERVGPEGSPERLSP